MDVCRKVPFTKLLCVQMHMCHKIARPQYDYFIKCMLTLAP